MGIQSAITASFAKTGTDASVGNDRRALRLNAAVMRKSRDVFPIKTAFHLHEITGYSVRACERWLSERVVIPTDALAALLQHESGRDFLAIVMVDATPRWWKQLMAWIRAVDYAAAERVLRRKRREILDADFATSPSFAEMLQDEEFYSAQPAPARGRPHAVVASKKR